MAGGLALLALKGVRLRAVGLLPPLLTLLPLALTYLPSAWRGYPLVLARYLTVAVPGLMLWLAQGVVSLPWRPLVPVATLLLLLAAVPGLSEHYSQVPIATAREMRALSAALEAEQPPLILVNLADVDPYFVYYLSPSLAARPTFAVPINLAQVQKNLEQAIAGQPEMGLLSLSYPGNVAQELVERHLEATMYRAEERWFGGVRWLRYLQPDHEPPPNALAAHFLAPSGSVRLVGYALLPMLTPRLLGVRLHWLVNAPLSQRYKVFVHLRDVEGRTVAQGDSEPLHGWRPIDSWRGGEVVVDRHTVLLPTGLAPGAYQVVVGIYDAAGPLPLEDGTWELSLGPISVGQR